jgi:hypothetical protein
LSGVGVSGLASGAGGGAVGSGAGADAGGGGGAASSFFVQPANVKAKANSTTTDNGMNSLFILASNDIKVSQYFLGYVDFTFKHPPHILSR